MANSTENQNATASPQPGKMLAEFVNPTNDAAANLASYEVSNAAALESALTHHAGHCDNSRLRQLIDFAPFGYLVTDERGVVKEANHTAAHMFGMLRAFFIEKPLGALVVPEDSRRFYSMLIEMTHRRHSERLSFDFRVRRQRKPGADASYIALTTSIEPHSREIESEPRYHWILQDVTERDLAQTTLREEQMFAKAVLEMAPAFILEINEQRRVVRANPGARSYLSRRNSPEAEWAEFFRPEDRCHAEYVLALAFENPGEHRLYARCETDEGVLLSVSWHFKSYSGRGGRPTVLAVGHNITDLEAAQAEALRNERLATIGHFMTTLAHESRNALQRAQACLERLTWRLNDQPEALDLVQRTQRAQADLTRLVDDVRIFSDEAPQSREVCPLVALWREAWGNIAAVRESMPRLADDHCDQSVASRSDRFRLLQVFRNLFENAIDAGATIVTVNVEAMDCNWLRISVRDDGQGISQALKDRVFDPFYTTKPHGSGLGMAICRRIVEAHGGRIWVNGTTIASGVEICFLLLRESP